MPRVTDMGSGTQGFSLGEAASDRGRGAER